MSDIASKISKYYLYTDKNGVIVLEKGTGKPTALEAKAERLRKGEIKKFRDASINGAVVRCLGVVDGQAKQTTDPTPSDSKHIA